MAGYWVPRTPDREERIFGGVLSLRQAVYLLAALLATAGAEALLPPPGAPAAAVVLRLLVALPAGLSGAVLAFGGVARFGMNADEALVRWWRWRRKRRRYVYRRSL